MNYRLRIYKNEEFYKEIALVFLRENTYTYKWEKIQRGSYSFEVINEKDEVFGVTYNHTAPFAHTFDTYLDKESKPKPITGFQDGIDILIKYNEQENTFFAKVLKQEFLGALSLLMLEPFGASGQNGGGAH